MKIKHAVLLLLMGAASVHAESVTVGQTYAIAERDALEEITERAKEIDWQKELATANITWSAKNGFPLKRATVDRSREFVPYHRIEVDIKDADGNVIYPAGFEFNVLNHITLPYRIVVIDPRDVEWVSPLLRDSDRVILTHGDFEDVSQVLERPSFMLDEKTQQRLGIEVVPSFVEQAGNRFLIDEFYVENQP